MTIPFNVPYGVVAVYGFGSTTGMAGFIPNSIDFRFATIYKIGNAHDVSFAVGDSVMWKTTEPTVTESRISIDNRVTFTMLDQSRLILKEVIP